MKGNFWESFNLLRLFFMIVLFIVRLKYQLVFGIGENWISNFLFNRQRLYHFKFLENLIFLFKILTFSRTKSGLSPTSVMHWERLTSNFYFFYFLPFLDRWMTSGTLTIQRYKKSPRLSLNSCVAFPFLFLFLFLYLSTPSFYGAFWAIIQSPFSHFPFLFLLFHAALSLSLSLSQKSLFIFFIFVPLKI